MNYSSKTLLCIVLALAGSTSFAAEELSLTPREGVVLLSNGQLLSGTIIPAGDRYDIQLESGEISLRRADVALICRDPQECYAHKRSGIEAGRVQDHLELAEWCIRNRLFDEAQRELNDAKRADATHPRIRLLTSRLELAKQPPPPTKVSAERTVSHTTLETVTRHLPPGTMETFTNSIQPLLLNNCSKSGCHSSRNDGGLKLERLHPRFPGRAATQRNLEQVLGVIDRENPSISRLLQAPIRPHGTVNAPIFTDRQQTQYRQLVQWVYAIAGSQAVFEKPSLEERVAPLLQTVPGATGMPRADEPANGPPVVDEADLPLIDGEMNGDGEPAAEAIPGELPAASQSAVPLPLGIPRDPAQQSPGPEDAYTPEQLKSMGLDLNGNPLPTSGARRSGGVQRGASLGGSAASVQRGAQVPAGFTAKDEFDPEIFNRRFFAR